MDIAGLAQALKTNLEALLNSDAFTTDSIEGWICILLFGYIWWNISRKAMRFVAWSVSVIFLFQVLYWLSFTGLNNYIPISTYVKFDVLTSIAQCFVGTRICDWLLSANAWMKAIVWQTWDFLSGGGMQDAIRSLTEVAK